MWIHEEFNELQVFLNKSCVDAQHEVITPADRRKSCESLQERMKRRKRKARERKKEIGEESFKKGKDQSNDI